MMAVTTFTSSPLTPVPSSNPESNHNSSEQELSYRATRQLPFELAQHVQIYFEEQMYMQAFRVLQSIISADASAPSDRPMTVPPPLYLSVTATLAVHPTLTTRTTSREKLEQASAALRLLRLLNETAGPVNAGFYDAFTFTRYGLNSTLKQDSDDDEDFKLNTPYAEAESIWSRAEDFWAVVGWALNCSCLPGMYATRWEYWCLWIEFMLDVLEADWQIHLNQDTSEESLLWQYIELSPGSNTRARRIMRATFADGSSQSLNEFREVFRKELKEPIKDGEKIIKKREVDVNVENEIYGDYMTRDDSDSASDNEPTSTTTTSHQRRSIRSSRRATPKTSNQSLRSEYYDVVEDSQTSTTTLGSSRSIAIRIRLLRLLVKVAAHPTITSTNPTAFPSLDDLYTLYVEFIKPLPLHTFQQIIFPSSSILLNDPEIHSKLVEFLLQRTIESSSSTTSLLSNANPDNLITQNRLEKEYLPFAASKSTVDANCRVSLLLEASLRLLMMSRKPGSLTKTKKLVSVLQEGTNRRLGKARDSLETRRKGVNKEDEEIAWKWLVESGQRMKMVVGLLGT